MSSATAAKGVAGSSPQGVLDIIEVGNRRELDQFLKVPWPIYKNDPSWVPPLLVERKEFLNPRKHPFYKHGAATMFLAMLNGQPVGRVLASDDPNYNLEHGTNAGCFGMFESVDDPRVAQALIARAGAWLRARGRTQLLGPIDYSMNYSCGLLIDGFDTPARVYSNHNPPYYSPLLDTCGLTKAKDLFAWWFEVQKNDLVPKLGRLADRLARRGNVVVRPFNLKDLKGEVERCKIVYNEAWENNWGFVRMTDPEFEHFTKSLAQLVSPDQLLLAEVEGEVVGFSLLLPDFNEAMRPCDGRLFRWGLPIGLVRFLYNTRKIRNGRLLALGVKQQYRRRGISELLILRTAERTKNQFCYDGCELGWTLEDNTLINSAIESVGGKHYKTYRIYEKQI